MATLQREVPHDAQKLAERLACGVGIVRVVAYGRGEGGCPIFK